MIRCISSASQGVMNTLFTTILNFFNLRRTLSELFVQVLQHSNSYFKCASSYLPILWNGNPTTDDTSTYRGGLKFPLRNLPKPWLTGTIVSCSRYF